MPSARYPKNAATTETFGPSFNTMYGYDAPITAATAKPQRIDRKDNSRTSAGFAAASMRAVPVIALAASGFMYTGRIPLLSEEGNVPRAFYSETTQSRSPLLSL